MDVGSFYLVVLMVCGIGDKTHETCQKQLLTCLHRESKTDKDGQAALTKCLAE